MFLSRNKKNNVYFCKPQFYFIKVGFKGGRGGGGQNYKACFRDAWCLVIVFSASRRPLSVPREGIASPL